jgi:2-dehydro-3-deoxyphosphogluconate aldolase / (4S)-4-hydroxy-2-oxoglutarate aldolase
MPASDLEPMLRRSPVVPVLVVESVATAVPLARALVAGGLPLLEITLRTEAALDVIRAIAAEVDGAVVGAGTVLTPAQLAEVERLGARFAVSPGATDALLAAARDVAVPLLPGAASASEVMRLQEHGYRCMKCFPAEPAGGIAYLKALASPLPGARFCPTGGIDGCAWKAYPNRVLRPPNPSRDRDNIPASLHTMRRGGPASRAYSSCRAE